MKSATQNSAAKKSATPKSAKSNPAESASSIVTASAIRILKVATCPSLSGKSKLTYHIGCSTDGTGAAHAEIHFRVFNNTGTGFFSREWVSLSAIEQAFATVPGEQCITSYRLFSLFQGKSLNTPAFLFAALKNEGWVQTVKDKPRSYERTDAKAFLAGIKVLIDAGTDLKIVEKSRPKNDDKVPNAKAVPVTQVKVVPARAYAVPVFTSKEG